jgi:hypothetical protein
MALQFALRPRIRLREETERPRTVQVPKVALPVGAYWLVMGLMTYGVSRAPAWLAASVDVPRELATGAADPVPLPPMTARTASGLSQDKGKTALELAPAWARGTAAPDPEGSPRVAEPAVAPPAPSEFTTTEPADPEPVPALGDERRTNRPSRHAAHEERHSPPPEMPLANTPDDRGAPSTWPAVPGLPPARPERDHVGMRSALDDLWEEPPEHDPSRNASRHDPAHGDVVRDAPAPRATTRAALVAAGSRISSCESVLAQATDEIDMTRGRGAPDVSRDAYAAILERGSYLSACSVPGGTVVEVCAAVQQGRAVGITVVSRPFDARVNGCVRGAVASLAFPANARLDVTRTRFDALRASKK